MYAYRSRLVPLALLLLLPLAVACEREPETTPADTEPAARAELPADVSTAFDGYIAAWNADDPAAVGRYFTDRASAVIGEERYQGRQQIVAEWVEPVLPQIDDLQIVELTSERDGDGYVTSGTYTGSSPEGEAFSGTYSATWTLDEDGQWRIDQSNVQPDAPPEG